MTGASGARYALQLLSHLVSGGLSVDLVYSPSARRVLLEECPRSLDGDPSVLLSGKEIPITPKQSSFFPVLCIPLRRLQKVGLET